MLMRTLIDIPPEQIQALASLGQSQRRSRAALVRDAIRDYLEAHQSVNAGQAFGAWGKRRRDGLAYQKKLRSEWER